MFNWSSIMKFAKVNGQRQEAQPRLSGNCPGCDSPMVARCGTKRVWHWAHLGERTCDVWWENETEWHRAWKNQFPVEWQEIVHRAENGEKHIADVKTRQGWVLEFQHSPIKSEERQARNDFYQRLIWVVDGTRRKSDKTKFIKVLQEGICIFPKFRVFSVFWMATLCCWSGVVVVNPFFLTLVSLNLHCGAFIPRFTADEHMSPHSRVLISLHFTVGKRNRQPMVSKRAFKH